MAISNAFVLFVGGLQRNKNLPRLVEAFRRADLGHLQLVIAGPDHNDSKVINREILGDARFVRLDSPTDEELAWLYFNCSYVTMPSLYEGQGLPIVEAMAFGKPILTSCIGAMSEVAGSAGLLVDPFDVDSIAGGLRRLTEDRLLAASLTVEASRRAPLFSWGAAAVLMRNLYLEAISSAPY
jgi:glycosyltransferase involved in cell wall biosynthesis